MKGVATDPAVFRTVFDEIAEGYVLVDDDGRCLEATSGATTVLGVERERLVGASIGDVAPGSTELDFTRGSEPTESTTREDGDRQRATRDVETATAPVSGSGTLVGVREASDGPPGGEWLDARTRLLARAVESRTIGLLVVADDDEVVATDGHAGPLFGFEQDAVVGRRFDDLWWSSTLGERGALSGSNPDSEPPEDPVLERVRAANGAVFDLERAIERSDGTTGWVSIDGAPIGGRESTDHVLLSLEDVTARQGYRRLLAAQNDRLDDYSEAVNHDLRGPLSIAHGWLEVAIEDGRTDGLEKAKTALDRMADHMDELREVARYSRTARDFSPLPVLPVAESAWSELASEDATLDVDEDLGTLNADRERLHALFDALFRNAGEHTDGDVTVRVGPLDDGFYVADDGAGIPPEHRDQVFEWGFSTTEDGFGLGLPLVAGIADAHGWTVSMTDVEPSGVRFEFRPRWHPELDG